MTKGAQSLREPTPKYSLYELINKTLLLGVEQRRLTEPEVDTTRGEAYYKVELPETGQCFVVSIMTAEK